MIYIDKSGMRHEATTKMMRMVKINTDSLCFSSISQAVIISRIETEVMIPLLALRKLTKILK